MCNGKIYGCIIFGKNYASVERVHDYLLRNFIVMWVFVLGGGGAPPEAAET